jgi:hypothetical protein
MYRSFQFTEEYKQGETGPITVPAKAMLLIIGFPLVWIAKDFIGLGYFLELEQCRGVVLVQVGVELFG